MHAMHFALAYRNRFSRDVFIDLLGYRKYGHNEGDEPRFTQPKLYKAIGKHKNPRDIYAAKLMSRGVINQDVLDEMETTYKETLEEKLEDARLASNTVITPFMQDQWTGYQRAKQKDMLQPVDTSIELKKLDAIAATLTELPSDKRFLRKTERLVKDRKAMYFERNQLDLAMG